MAIAVAALAAALPSPARSATPVAGPPIVATAAGRLGGSFEGELAVFRGVPFAAPPVGDLRWRDPQPFPAWDGVRPARDSGNACIQRPGVSAEDGGAPGPYGEDCLVLQVWSPRPDAAARLPVLEWIHGGALIGGAGSMAIYDGASLARRGAVVVAINYRLGALGFFAHPSIGTGGPGGSVNFGLLDQMAALRWVRANVAGFGGDPDNVTIFGQSAGAESVLALFASPLASGLFAKGIAQSPYGLPSHSMAKARATAIKVAEAVGLAGKSATAEALRSVPAEAFAGLDKPGLSLAPAFVVGDRALPQPILRTFQQGREAPLPLIIGHTSNDSSVAFAFGVDPAALVRKAGAARIAVKPLYPAGTDDAELGRLVVRDLLFGTFAKRLAWLHAPRAPTWRYYFDYVPAGLRASQPGTAHGGEVVWIMGTAGGCECIGGPLSDTDRRLMAAMGDRWFGFAAAGTPDLPDSPVWPRDRRAAPNVMVFDSAARSTGDFMKARLDAFTVMLNLLDRIGPAR